MRKRVLVVASLLVLVGLVAGAVWALPRNASSDADCTKVTVIYGHDDRRPKLAPPRPAGSLTMLSARTYRFTWKLPSLPSACRPDRIELVLKLKAPLTAFTSDAPIKGKSGTKVVAFAPGNDFPVTYGMIAARMPGGLTSGYVRIPRRH